MDGKPRSKVVVLATLCKHSVLIFLQGMTNDVKFTFSVGDTTHVDFDLVTSQTNRFGDTKYNS